MDNNTGLPKLPKGQVWEVEANDFETEPHVIVRILQEGAYRKSVGNLHWLDGEDPEESLTRMCEQDYGDKLIKLSDVKISRSEGPQSGPFWNKKPAWVSESVSGTATLHYWFTLETSEDSIPATPEAIRDEAKKIVERIEKKNAATKLYGMYPPNKMEANE